jgi:putative SOS response-associated peptidase YedK
MCGRYLITSSPEAIRNLFRYAEEPDFPPRYNVAPTQPVPIVRLVNGARSFALARWGLIPAWVKEPNAFSLLINARGETVGDKPAFRNAMRYRRCLFPADGSTSGSPRADASARSASDRAADSRSPSPAFGKPGPARTARRSTPPVS